MLLRIKMKKIKYRKIPKLLKKGEMLKLLRSPKK